VPVKPFRDFVPLRATPDANDDGYDPKRLVMVNTGWSSQDDLRRFYHRQIEENVRMLAGQQWSIFHPVLQRWLDVTEWMSEKERRWRLRPVFNRLLPWFMLTHARSTENPPILTWIPGPDRIDAELADVMDTSFKVLWREVGMVDLHDRIMAWVIAAGRSHFQTRIDLTGGPMRKWVGEGQLPMLDPGTGDVLRHPQTGEVQYHPDVVPNVPFGPSGTPFDAQGNPLAVMTPDGPQQRGEPHEAPEGRLVGEVLSPLECRGTWGPQAWHEKPEHYTRQYLTPEQVWDQWGVECEPDVRGNVGDVGELERLLFGTGFFNAASGGIAAQTTTGRTDGYCTVTCLWQVPKPYEGMEKSKDSPGGRYTVATRNKILRDGPRPAAFEWCSPIRCFDFVRLPGRPAGTTPLEAMVPVQRSYNRSYAQVGEFVNLCANPKPIIDTQFGIKDGQWTNEPGTGFVGQRRPGVPAVEWVAPPPLGAEIFQYIAGLRGELDFMGNVAGSQGEAPTEDASGELVKELRFNSDRFFGPTARRNVEEYGRLAVDWKAMLPIIWDDEKVLSYAGEDNVARTMTVLPYMWKEGKVNCIPDAESMLPEGRGERQARVYKMWQDGAYGDPASPEARKMFFDLARFPHLSRAAKPGGVHRVTAEQFNGMLMQGTPAEQVPIYPWYDLTVHLFVLQEFMAAPEFLRVPPPVKDNFIKRWTVISGTLQQQAAQQQAAQMEQQVAVAQASAAARGGKAPGAPPGLAPGAPKPPSGGVPGGQYPTAMPNAGATV
jgi:hypothetical protein